MTIVANDLATLEMTELNTLEELRVFSSQNNRKIACNLSLFLELSNGTFQNSYHQNDRR